jgi:dipeptide/tripeptide permease
MVIQGGGMSALFSIFVNEVITANYGYSAAFYMYGVFTCVTIVLVIVLRERYDWKNYLNVSTKQLLKVIQAEKIEEEDEEDTA